MRLTIMNYDENIFKEKANRKARKIWLIFALLLSANYGSDVANGLQKADYYIIFLILCWLPIILGEILLRVKGFTTDIYKYDLVIGYGIFYTFVVSTTASPIAPCGINRIGKIKAIFKFSVFLKRDIRSVGDVIRIGYFFIIRSGNKRIGKIFFKLRRRVYFFFFSGFFILFYASGESCRAYYTRCYY